MNQDGLSGHGSIKHCLAHQGLTPWVARSGRGRQTRSHPVYLVDTRAIAARHHGPSLLSLIELPRRLTWRRSSLVPLARWHCLQLDLLRFCFLCEFQPFAMGKVSVGATAPRVASRLLYSESLSLAETELRGHRQPTTVQPSLHRAHSSHSGSARHAWDCSIGSPAIKHPVRCVSLRCSPNDVGHSVWLSGEGEGHVRIR